MSWYFLNIYDRHYLPQERHEETWNRNQFKQMADIIVSQEDIYGDVGEPPYIYIFLKIMLSDTDDLLTRSYEIAAVAFLYGGLVNLSVRYITITP